MNYILYIESRPDALRDMLSKKPVAYVPFGALEWHGEHNPLGLDGIKAQALCEQAAQKTGGVVFPCVYWGAFDTMPFPFTLHFKRYGTRRMIRDMLKQLEDWGFRMIVLLTGHYPASQVKLLSKECQRFNKSGPAYALGVPEQVFGADKKYYGDHAAMWETSIMMALRPDLVRLEAMPEGLSTLQRCREVGVMGKDPRKHADAEKGRDMAEHITDRLAAVVERTLADESPEAINEALERYRAAMKPSMKLAREALDVASLRELLSYGWWYFRNF